MAFKLDDILHEKKKSSTALDLSRTVINSREELESIMEKVPDFKMHAEKVHPQDTAISSNTNFRSTKQERAAVEFQYPDPVPESMRSVNLEDLSNVNIPWRMLTMARPRDRREDEFFNRLVVLARARRAMRKENPALPIPTPVPRAKNSRRGKSHVTEMHFATCKECLTELCQGVCGYHGYEPFVRCLPDSSDEDTGKTVASLIDGNSKMATSSGRKNQSSRKAGSSGLRRKRRKLKKRRRKKHPATTDVDSDEIDGEAETVALPDAKLVTLCSAFSKREQKAEGIDQLVNNELEQLELQEKGNS